MCNCCSRSALPAYNFTEEIAVGGALIVWQLSVRLGRNAVRRQTASRSLPCAEGFTSQARTGYNRVRLDLHVLQTRYAMRLTRNIRQKLLLTIEVCQVIRRRMSPQTPCLKFNHLPHPCQGEFRPTSALRGKMRHSVLRHSARFDTRAPPQQNRYATDCERAAMTGQRADQYPRFFGGNTCSEGQSVELSRDQSEHLARVMRRGEGDLVRIFTGSGREFLAEVVDASPKATQVRIRQRLRAGESGDTALALAFAPPRGQRSDFLVEKATELGVDHLQPLLARRVQSNYAKAARKRTDRWRRKAIEAARQSERISLPHIAEPVTLEKFLQGAEQEMRLLADLRPEARPVWGALNQTDSRPESVAILIGPVGGFTRSELKQIESSGAMPVSLGRNVLRVETAAVAMVSAVRCWLDSFGKDSGRPTS